MKKIFLIWSLLFISCASFAGSLYVSENISAQNTFSDPLNLGYKSGAVLTLSGTWVANVTLQRSDILGVYTDVTDTDGNVVTFTQNGTYVIKEPTLSANYKFGVKTGNYTSGTVVGVLEYN